MYDVITIGSATRDVFLQGLPFDKHKDSHFQTGLGTCFPIGSKVEVKNVVFTTGGAGVNAAVTFARQGFGVASIVRVGSDVSGETIQGELQKEKVDTRFIQHDPKLPTAYSVLLMTPKGERTIFSYKGAGQSISIKEIPWSKIKSRWLYIDSLQGSVELLKKIIYHARKNKIKLVIDPGGKDIKVLKKNPKLLRAFDVYKTNQEEASYLTGVAYKSKNKVFKKLSSLVGGIAVMTSGPLGLWVSDGGTLWKAGIFKEQKVVDRTGAGDAFGSGFVAGLIQKNDIEYAIRLGSANATSVVEHMGAHEGILSKNKFTRDKRWKRLKIERL